MSFNPCFSGTRARTSRCWLRDRRRPGFNPCFSGTRARTLEATWDTVVGTDVSILVFLELAPGPRCRLAGRMGYRFQSLFFWNSRPDLIYHQINIDFQPVSILVFLELAPGPQIDASEVCRRPGFNPCFSGTRARTGLRKMRKDDMGVVSILVFLELAPGLQKPLQSRRPLQFQSLFFWNSRPDCRRKSGRRDTSIVSILVFLELAPGRAPLLLYGASILVSILVFLELAPGRVQIGSIVKCNQVSILVFLELAPGHGRTA